MTLTHLVIAYLVVGVACAFVVHRVSAQQGRASVAAAALAIPLWPLWAPIALMRPPDKTFAPVHSPIGAAALARIDLALREGLDAARGSPMEALLPGHAASQIREEVKRASMREAELAELLARPGFDLRDAERRVRNLEADGASARALATARVHMENIRRLQAIRAHDARCLAELAELAETLRTQLVLSRYSGSSIEGVGGILTEVWARVEGLGAAIDGAIPPMEPSHPSPRGARDVVEAETT